MHTLLLLHSAGQTLQLHSPSCSIFPREISSNCFRRCRIQNQQPAMWRREWWKWCRCCLVLM